MEAQLQVLHGFAIGCRSKLEVRPRLSCEDSGAAGSIGLVSAVFNSAPCHSECCGFR